MCVCVCVCVCVSCAVLFLLVDSSHKGIANVVERLPAAVLARGGLAILRRLLLVVLVQRLDTVERACDCRDVSVSQDKEM